MTMVSTGDFDCLIVACGALLYPPLAQALPAWRKTISERIEAGSGSMRGLCMFKNTQAVLSFEQGMQ